MIQYHGTVPVPTALIEQADAIKLLNYKTTTPERFRKRTLTEEVGGPLLTSLADILKVEPKRLDYVYFSVCKGAQPHVDALDPLVFGPTTLVVPVILPKGRSIIEAEGAEAEVHVGGVYEFNHERIHSMTLEDTESGCVVVMVAVRHAQ